MEKWLPIFLIIAGGIAFFALLFLVEYLKGHSNKHLVKPVKQRQ